MHEQLGYAYLAYTGMHTDSVGSFHNFVKPLLSWQYNIAIQPRHFGPSMTLCQSVSI